MLKLCHRVIVEAGQGDPEKHLAAWAHPTQLLWKEAEQHQEL
jgi:hypothetical protein